MRLKGKLAIVTAAASGIGRAGCEVFAAQGAEVVAIDIDRGRLDDVVGGVKAKGGKAHAVVADLLAPEGCRAALREALTILGGLDVLWNNAGMPGKSNVEDLDIDAFDRAMSLNVRTSAIISGLAVPEMKKRGGGSIIFTSSVAGLVGATVSPIYSAAKFGVVGFAKSLALRYAPDGIRSNALCPGPVETPMAPLFFDPEADPVAAAAAQAKVVAAVPLGRVAQPIEVAYAAAWLASDEASFVTGAAIPIDGGITAR